METLRAGYGLDGNGYIISDAYKEKISDIFQPCIQDSIERLKSLFGAQLHSVYVYGSVARGEAIVRKSDLDLIAMFKGNLDADSIATVKKLGNDLSEKYTTLIREVGIAIAFYDYTLDPANYYENAFISELSVCLYGEDLGERFGPYKLTKEIPIRFNGDINKSLSRVLTNFDKATESDFKLLTQNFARKLIRTFYSMVMVRSQIWTTRLKEQADVFIHYFPKKQPVLLDLLHWIDEPPTDRQMVIQLFQREGEWASKNFIQEASILPNVPLT
ncbi:nucleotidyltransferase domain-containing protein [Ornithinibacillus scapharcae]|uniref:nucleotidyltransferase domain-containing protein n=1 Tax=Ornithinibacillus scapharcae TaxID=1147159 RepID=UPI000225AA84|nr:nucleotidyltransferase domain-containing protein [Ornithinibacillus scapharcae]